MGVPLILLFSIIPALLAQECAHIPPNPPQPGGTPPPPGWPWLVGITFNGQLACGGSLINHDWVLSAASCFMNTDTMLWAVNLGRISPNATVPPEVTRSVQQIILHPNYDNMMHESDVALIKLSQPVDFNSTVHPVCLASAGSVFPTGATCLALGLGNLPMNGSAGPPMLQELQVPVIGNRQCTCQFGNGYVSPLKICTEASTEMCMGDFGGPLMCQQNNTWVQAGVASFKLSCNSNYPDIYSRVSEFQYWMMEYIDPSTVGFVTFNSTGFNSDDYYTCYDFMSIFGAANIGLPTKALFLVPILILFERLFGAF